MNSSGEFALIQQFFTRTSNDAAVKKSVGDDAAIIAVPAHMELVVSTDTLVAGRHFLNDAAPFDIGWKSLAVNLSDLAAMGASARWVTLAITLPAHDDNFLQEFSRGFWALAAQENISLVGGDTTRGPLSITVTAMGVVPQGAALLRSGAQLNDDIYVSGCVGDAGLGLRLALQQWPQELSAHAHAQVLRALHLPQPRLGLGAALRGVATACMDISDGLAQDLTHVLRASGVGASLELNALPRSAALAEINAEFADVLALTSGDDYELLFTAPESARGEVHNLTPHCTRIGKITGTKHLVLLRGGAAVDLPVAGFTHF